MPRYFFHFDCPAGRLRDEVGVPLPDAEAAWYQAVRSARERIETAAVPAAADWEHASVEIMQEGGLPVDRVPLIEIARFQYGAR
jgi:hypothetical protein